MIVKLIIYLQKMKKKVFKLNIKNLTANLILIILYYELYFCIKNFQNSYGFHPCTVQPFQYHKFRTITKPKLNPVWPNIAVKTPESLINANFLLNTTNGIAHNIA
jgi:hypothetical protein